MDLQLNILLEVEDDDDVIIKNIKEKKKNMRRHVGRAGIGTSMW